MKIDTGLVFAFAGPLFLLLGAWRAVAAPAQRAQMRTWLLLGGIFSVVAIWLWWHQAN